MERPLFLPGVGYGIALDRLFTAREVDDFIALYQDRNTTELALHKFFAVNPKFLYLLGAYQKVLSEVSFFGTPQTVEAERNCFRLDFLLQHYQNVWDVVEIKKATLASSSLLVGSSVRPRFAYELRDAIAQVRVYLDQLAQDEVQKEFESRGIIVRRPKAFIIAGLNDDIAVSEKRFLAQALPHSIEYLTYDDLAELAKQNTLIEIKSVQFPLLSRLQEDVADARRLSEIPPDVAGDEQVRHALEAAVGTMSDADLLRLRAYARWRMLALREHARGRDADDLLSEAVLATLNGNRTWRTGIPLTTHLTGAMRSISSHWQCSPREESLESHDFELPEMAERKLMASEKLQHIRMSFGDEPDALRILDLMSSGYASQEIQALLNLSSMQFSALSRRIRRRLTEMAKDI